MFRRLGAAYWRLRLPAAHATRDLPLQKTLERAILASNHRNPRNVGLNRAGSLRRTLDSLAAMRVARDLAWELIVVNNNSTDQTDAVIAEYRDRLPFGT